MTFKSKLFIATIIPAVLTLVVAGFGIRGTKNTDSSMNEIGLNGTAIRNHLEGDMMHDGMRADVLAALFDVSSNGGKNKDQILADTDEHGAWFKRVLGENEKLPLSPEIKKAIAEAKPALDEYIASAHEVSSLAYSDFEAAKAKLSDFETKFGELEEKNEALSSLIMKASDDAGKKASPVAANAIRSLLIISLLSIITGIVVMLSINRQLQRGLNTVCSAAEMARSEITNSYLTSLQSLARGDLTFAPPSEVLPVQYSEKNEIGHFVNEFNGMIASLNESSHALGAAQEGLAQMVAMIQTNSQSVSQTSAGIACHAEKNRSIAETLAASSQEAKAINTETVETMNALKRSLDDVTSDLEKQSETVLETSQLLSKNAIQLDLFVESTESMANSATGGRKALEESNVAISRVEIQAKGAAEKIQELEDSARQIGSIVTTIEDIAEQTNLLALNAAIEAARAGEQGRGFAVVADEVRKLAEQSRDATHKIGNLVTSVLELVERSVAAIELTYSEAQSGAVSMKTTELALEELLERIAGVTSQIDTIQKSNSIMGSLMDKVVELSQESKASVSTHLEARCAELLTSIEAVATFATQNAEQAEDVTYSADDVDRAVRDLSQMAKELQVASSKFRVRTEGSDDLRIAA